MNARRLAIVLVFFGLASRSESQQVDAKKLCELIRTPSGSMMVGLGFNTQRGFVIAGESVDHSAEIAALEKALCGDAMDAERYYRLSEIYDDREKCERASAKAAELFRKQLQADPRNGRLAMRLGQSLPADNDADAEKWLRQAVTLAPRDAECWLALGDFLWNKSFEALVGPSKKGQSQIEALMNIVVTHTVPPENLQKSRKIAREACDCMDRAVAAGPRDPRHYLARSLARSLFVALEEGTRPAPADNDDLLDSVCRIYEQLSKAKVFADMQQAAALEPNNPRAQVFAGAAEMLTVAGAGLVKMKSGDAKAKDRFMKDLEGQGIRIGTKLITMLDALTKHQDKRIVAEACYFEALLLTLKVEMLKDEKTTSAEAAKVESLLRRSINLAPGNQSAWDLLMGAVMGQDNKEKELIEICEARLRFKDNAPNRFWAAKALVQLNRYAEAEKHIRIGLERDADSTINHVGLAAVLLRSNDPAKRPEALQHLEKAEKLLARNSNGSLAEDVAMLRAVHVALGGDPDTARTMLHSILAKNKKNETAEGMLKVIGKSAL